MLKKIVTRLFFPGLKNDDTASKKKQIFISALFSLTCFVFLVLYGLTSMVSGHGNHGIFLFFIAAACLTTYAYLYRTGNSQITCNVIVYLMILLGFYLLCTGGVNNTGPLWLFVVPMLIFYVQSFESGPYSLAFFLIGCACILFVPDMPLLLTTYDPLFSQRLMSALIGVSILSFGYEYSRIDDRNAERKRVAAEAAAQARRVFLDNSGQGFLSFDKDLLIKSEYSKECEHIFGQPIGAKSVVELLIPEDPYARGCLEKNFQRIFSETDRFKKELYFSLLPKEYCIGSFFVDVGYKMVQDSIMLILTDVTQRKKLQDEVLKERNRLKFVVSTVRASHNFFSIIEEFKKFCTKDIAELFVGTGNPSDILSEIYRRVHTFKGIFALHEFVHIPKALHQMEEQLSILLHDSGYDKDMIKERVASLKCKEMLRKDLDIIKDFIGPHFMEHKGEISLSREQALRLEFMIQRYIGEQCASVDDTLLDILGEIRAIRYVGFRSLIADYPKYAACLADRLGRELKPISVSCGDISIDPHQFVPFAKSLIHVFRNAVEHGLETPEERLELGKPEQGVITCDARLVEGHLVVTISDDGRGLDFGRIKEIAVSKNYITPEAADELSDDAAGLLIFSMHVSTCEHVSELSGRGVGLAAVKAEVDRLNGRIAVDSRPGQGVTFRFVLPCAGNKEVYPEKSSSGAGKNSYLQFKSAQISFSPDKSLSVFQLGLTSLEEISKRYLHNNIDVLMSAVVRYGLSYLQKKIGFPVDQVMHRPHCVSDMNLRYLTAMVRVGGDSGAYIVLSFDEPLIKELFLIYTQGLIIDSREKRACLEETAADIVNTLVGNAMAMLPDGALAISMTPPVMISREKDVPWHKDAYFFGSDLLTDLGEVKVMCIGPKLFFETIPARMEDDSHA